MGVTGGPTGVLPFQCGVVTSQLPAVSVQNKPPAAMSVFGGMTGFNS